MVLPLVILCLGLILKSRTGSGESKETVGFRVMVREERKDPA